MKGKKTMLPCHQCKCKSFAFIPSRPEDVGEFWFQRRRDFDVSQYRVKCRCKHAHDVHDAVMRSCKEKGAELTKIIHEQDVLIQFYH